MSCNWPKVKTGELFDLINGYAFKSKDFLDDGLPVLKIKNVKAGQLNLSNLAYVDGSFESLKSDKIVQKNDLLISMSGNRHDGSMETWVGKVCWFNELGTYLVNQRVGILRLKSGVDINPRFIAYQLSSVDFQKHFISVATSSGGQANLNPKQITETEVFVPSREIQDSVVNIIGMLEDKSVLNARTNQTLEQMAQAIFKSWFVDFEPVKAKMNGEQPEGMDAATASLFPEKLVESELGLIPEGWDAGTLSDVAKYCSARTSIDSICLDNYISTENMLADRKGVTAASKLPTAKMVAAYRSGDVLVSNIRPYFKKIWLAEGNGGRSNDVLGFESSVPNTDAYIMNLLYQDTFFEYMTRTSKGAKMPRGDKTAIMNWEIAVPPVELREAYSAIVDKFYKLIPQNRAQNETLESLRDTLLPKLLSGEIELGTNEELVEAI